MAYEASQSGFRGLITAEEIHNVAGDTPNRMGIKFQPTSEEIPPEVWLNALLADIKSRSPFAAYQGGRIRFDDDGGSYGDHSFRELREIKDAESWSREMAQRYANGAVKFVVYRGKKMPDADALLVFSSGQNEGIFLYITTMGGLQEPAMPDKRRVRQLVKPFVAEGQLDDIVRELFD